MRDMKSRSSSIKLSEDDNDDDPQHFGYWVDLSQGLQFNENDRTWIQAMPLGTYQHPVHGSIVISKERVKSFADNVNNNVRGQELDIDYEHKAKVDDAAGWVKEAKVNFSDPNPKARGLYLLVEWTAEAANKIRDKAFRYFSPEFVDNWTHPQTQHKHSDVLFGGALTNRPFLKGILPINLSELVEQPDTNSNDNTEGDDEVDREFLEAMAKSLGVKFDKDTSDEDLQTALGEAAEADPETDEDADDDAGSGDNEEELVSASDLVKLAESSPAIKALIDKVEKLEMAGTLADTRVRLSELKTGDNQLTPAAVKKLSDIMNRAPKEVADTAFDLIKEVLEGKATVQLNEKGGRKNGSTQSDSDGSAADEFEAEVTKLTEGENGISYADAVEEVSATNPDLFESYRQESFAGGSA